MPKSTRNVCRICGWAGVVVSLVPWIIGGLKLIPRLSRVDLSFNQVVLFLAFGVVLSFIAAIFGSRRWAFVALFDLGALFLLLVLLNLQELR